MVKCQKDQTSSRCKATLEYSFLNRLFIAKPFSIRTLPLNTLPSNAQGFSSFSGVKSLTL